MDINFEQKVRERAYHIWMAAGMADGMAHEHWVTAEQAVANETGAPAKPKKAVAAKAKTASVKKAPAKAAKPAATKAATKTANAKSSKAKH